MGIRWRRTIRRVPGWITLFLGGGLLGFLAREAVEATIGAWFVTPLLKWLDASAFDAIAIWGISIGLGALLLYVVYRFGQVNCGDPDFYADRASLERALRFPDRLKTASRIHALFAVGDKFINMGEGVDRVARLILPNPESGSLLQYAESRRHQVDIPMRIRQATARAQERSMNVRWCPEFIGYSGMIGDPDEDSGWAHIEMILPGTPIDARPSLTIYRSEHPGLFQVVKDAFDRMWSISVRPSGDQTH